MLRFMFALLVMASSCYSQVITSPTTWTKAMSPITVTSVNIYSILTIEAGVEVRFTGGGKLTLWNGNYSKLIVNGTPEQPVLFRSTTGDPWRGLSVVSRSTRPVIRLNNAVFENLGATTRVFDLINADAYFYNCSFSGLAVVPSGTQAGQTTSFWTPSATNPPIGGLENCEISGFTTGIVFTPGIVMIDCDFTNVLNPVRGRLLGVSALGL